MHGGVHSQCRADTVVRHKHRYGWGVVLTRGASRPGLILIQAPTQRCREHGSTMDLLSCPGRVAHHTLADATDDSGSAAAAGASSPPPTIPAPTAALRTATTSEKMAPSQQATYEKPYETVYEARPVPYSPLLSPFLSV